MTGVAAKIIAPGQTAAFATFLAAATAVVVGATIPAVDSDRLLLLTLLGFLLPLPLLVRAVQGKFDPFEPIALASLLLFVLFFLRPLAHIAFHEYAFGRWSMESGFDRALTIIVVGSTALYIGYAVPYGRRIARRITPLPLRFDDSRLRIFAALFFGVGVVLSALFIVQVGGVGVAKSLVGGRQPGEGVLFANASVYFSSGPLLAIPAALILLATGGRRPSRGSVLAATLVIGLYALVSAPRGDRMWLMVLGVGLVVQWYLRRGSRPTVRTLAVVGIAWFAFGITFLGAIRVPEARSESPSELAAQLLSNPTAGWRTFILGPDTEMFSVISVMADEVPAKIPHQPGISFLTLGTNWIPSDIWAGKPETADIQFYKYLFPERYSFTKAGTAPSIFGGFYYDSGIAGVFLGGILVGILLRLFYEYLVTNPHHAGVQLAFAVCLPFCVVLLRSNLTDTFARMLFIAVPAIIAAHYSGTRRTRFSAD